MVVAPGNGGDKCLDKATGFIRGARRPVVFYFIFFSFNQTAQQ